MPAKKKTKKKSAPRKSSGVKRAASRAVGAVRRRAKSVAAKINPQSMLINTALAVVGAIGVAALVGAIPKKKDGSTILPTKFMPLLPVAGGLALAMTVGKKQKMVQPIATGAMVAGGLSLVRAMAPQVPLLADEALMGAESFIPADVEAAAMLGSALDSRQSVNLADDEDVLGAETQLADDEDVLGAETQLADDEDVLGDDEDVLGMDDRYAAMQSHGYVTARSNM